MKTTEDLFPTFPRRLFALSGDKDGDDLNELLIRGVLRRGGCDIPRDIMDIMVRFCSDELLHCITGKEHFMIPVRHVLQ